MVVNVGFLSVKCYQIACNADTEFQDVDAGLPGCDPPVTGRDTVAQQST